jgi:peptidyl-prolyl cis-trans isomerase C
MTALALDSKLLNFHAKKRLRPAVGLGRALLGPLQRTRLEVVLAQAEQAGIKGSIPETLRDPRLVGLLARYFKVPVPGREACERYYRDHAEAFREPDRFVGRQIVLRCPPSDPPAMAEARARAERLIAILFFDSRMFSDLVATYDSISDESGSGGIGPVARGELPEELDLALFGLRPGQIYPAPVSTEAGIHVLVLDRIIPGEIAPFASVHGRIAATLRGQLRAAAALRHLSRLADHYLASMEGDRL